MDFDGDTVALYKVHDTKSLDELYNNSFSMNINEYDHNSSLLHKLSKENEYAFNILKNSEIDLTISPINIQNLSELKYSNKINLNTPIIFNGVKYSYGMCLLCKFAKFNDININILTDPFRLIYNLSKSNEEYHKQLAIFVNNLNFFLSTYASETLTFPLIESIDIITKTKNMPTLPSNPIVGQHIFKSYANLTYSKLSKQSQLYKMLATFSTMTQFERCLLSIGYIADDNNLIKQHPIQNNILFGTTQHEFFESSYGTRKSLIDKDQNVPISGYMQRAMVINLSSIEIVEHDCNSKYGFKIKILNDKHGNSLCGRYYYNDKKLVEYIHSSSNIGKYFLFRSPITCQTKNFKICQICAGKLKTKSPFVGVMAGQYIEERLTQLTMSSFHTSGSGCININEKILTFFKHITNVYEHNNVIEITFSVKIPNHIIDILRVDTSFKFISHTDYIIKFETYDQPIPNSDINLIVTKLNKLLLTQPSTNNKLIGPDEAYYEFISLLHTVSDIYSLFVELLFTNVYLTKDNILIRYALANGDTQIVKKLNIKSQYKLQSSTIGLLFEPNQRTILKYCKEKDHIFLNNIFERIWLHKL